jgi:translation initiation factor 2 subunit 2
MMKRNPEHVFQFMMAELGTEGSIDGNARLVIRGKFVPKVRHFLSLLVLSLCVSCPPLVHRILA